MTALSSYDIKFQQSDGGAMSFSKHSFILMILLTVHGSLQKSSPTSPTYRAAVVEFNSVLYRNDAARTLHENTVKMEKFIDQAANENVDIVVFPELIPTTVALPPRKDLDPWTTKVPAASAHYAPCGSNDTSISDCFRDLACAAKRCKIYVAINLVERENCIGKDCPLDGLYYYVTSVVFDREGVIVSRYRKSYLNYIDTFDVVNPPEMLTFTSDFGVTFSHIICFDILFQKPWMNVAREMNVTDFIFQTARFVELPFMSGIQLESSLSYIADVNLLAAGYNWAKDGYTGSGIYAGRQGILTATVALEDYEELLIADVPKKIKTVTSPSIARPENDAWMPNRNQEYQIHHASFRKNDARFFRVVNNRLDQFETKSITRNGSVVGELSHNGIHCKFEVNVTNLTPPATYRMVVYDGPSSCGDTCSIDTRICSILSCTDATLDSCGRIHNSSTIFQSIEVTSVILDHANTTMTPNSLRSNMFPFRYWFFDQRKEKEHLHTLMLLTKPTQGLITFGVWGRNYDEHFSNSKTESLFSTRTSAFIWPLGPTALVILLANLLFRFFKS